MQAITTFKQGWNSVRPAAAFRRSIIGWVLVVLNTIAALNSTYFFLGMLRVGVGDWLMMNTCVPSIALFVAGFLLGSPVVMVAGAALMFRYGTLGLFVFSWEAYNLIPQIGHILMTLAVIYVLADIVRGRRWQALALGLAVGAVILVPLYVVQESWCAAHPDLVQKLFSGNLAPPGQ